MNKLKALRGPLLGLFFGISISLLLSFWAGENPFNVLWILLKGSFGSRYAIGMTLFYSTPLIFTGLSVAIAFHAGLFNIGAEGQLAVGALAAAVVGAVWPNIPAPWSIMLAISAALAAGGFWGWLPGWLRVKRGSHEVINTIMLNFVAAGLASYVTLNVLPNPASQNPETAPIGSGYMLHDSLHTFFAGAPISLAFPFAIICALVLEGVLYRTVFGFSLRAVGQNEQAARTGGINVGKIRIAAMTLAGALAGLVAVGEVLGNSGRFRLGFSPDYGFIGIAVALLASCSPVGVVFAAILFGALHNGALSLDLETDKITRDFSLIMQALVILFVSVRRVPALRSWRKRVRFIP